mmetsp:Transcript_115573/g.331767  ORF Transcript_115573/g.331767 Transcript_115573/m.331767 type:complete len:203 (-) Transcript_115573:223-831(-)
MAILSMLTMNGGMALPPWPTLPESPMIGCRSVSSAAARWRLMSTAKFEVGARAQPGPETSCLSSYSPQRSSINLASASVSSALIRTKSLKACRRDSRSTLCPQEFIISAARMWYFKETANAMVNRQMCTLTKVAACQSSSVKSPRIDNAHAQATMPRRPQRDSTIMPSAFCSRLWHWFSRNTSMNVVLLASSLSPSEAMPKL